MLRPFGRRRIAGANHRPQWRQLMACLGGILPDFGQRHFEVAADVVRQRLQRRDINDLRLVGQLALDGLPEQAVDRGQKGRQRFARAGRGGDQRVSAGNDFRPAQPLRLGRLPEAVGKPAGRNWVKKGNRHRRLVAGRALGRL